MTLKKITLILISALCILSCSSDDDSSSNPPEGNSNMLVVNGVEYPIATAISYTEANTINNNTVLDYYFDIIFLTDGIDVDFNDGEDHLSGNGSLFYATFINETNTFLDAGEYTSAEFADDVFEMEYPEAYIDFNFNTFDFDFDDPEEMDGYNIVEDNSTTFNVSRNGNVYTITGSGVFPGNIPYSLEYTGALTPDPASE